MNGNLVINGTLFVLDAIINIFKRNQVNYLGENIVMKTKTKQKNIVL